MFVTAQHVIFLILNAATPNNTQPHEKAPETAVDCVDSPEYCCAHRPALARRCAAFCPGGEHWVSGAEFGGVCLDGGGEESITRFRF